MSTLEHLNTGYKAREELLLNTKSSLQADMRFTRASLCVSKSSNSIMWKLKTQHDAWQSFVFDTCTRSAASKLLKAAHKLKSITIGIGNGASK